MSCTAKDATGNESDEKTFDVKVQDTIAPAIDAHADVTEEATGPDGATVDYTKPAANDVVNGSVDVNCTPDSGSTFELGTTAVTCSATDAAGNSSQSSFKVTVEDTTAPTLDAHDDVSATATSSEGAVVDYTKPAANDAVDPSPVVTCSPVPGSTFPVGSTTVSCTAKDATGNESAAETFEVNVVKENVAYEWSGFLQPINVSGTQSVFKIGSTVPVKFKLTGDSAGITMGTSTSSTSARVMETVRARLRSWRQPPAARAPSSATTPQLASTSSTGARRASAPARQETAELRVFSAPPSRTSWVPCRSN